MEIKVKYLNDYAKPIGQVVEEDSWCDLRAGEDHAFVEGEFYMLSLGVCIELPPHYEAIIAPRSSLFKNYGLLQANGIGIVDSSYNGDGDIWKIPLYATKDIVVNAGDRIAQFRIQKTQGHIDIKVVDKLGNEDRGGFGSSGKN